VQTFLVNAKISNKTYNFWSFISKIGLNIFTNFTAIFAQDQNSYRLLQNLLSQQNLYYYGNLKCLVFPASFTQQDLLFLEQNIGNRNCFIASNTHKKEEKMTIEIHQNLLHKF
jgi:3-deoxy-D-manno-octulosonic-acid transferase